MQFSKANILQSYRIDHSRKGQLMVLFGLFMAFMIIGFFALAMDFTMIYHTKAMLSRTVDALALRLVNRYSKQHTDSDRQRIAQSIFEANFDLLRKSESISWTWLSNGNSITSTQGETITGSGKNAAGDVKYSLEINTKADDQTGVVVTNVSGSAEHDTLLLPYFSKDYETFDFKANAETERFPSVNAIIIDLSGSMRGNQGATGIVGSGTTDGAVVQFIEEFDEERDYMLLVGFANSGKVMWPPTPEGVDSDTGLPFFKPSRFFLSGTGIEADAYGNKTIEEIIENNTGFTGWTNGGEGLRVAAQNVQYWLDNEPALQNPTIRDKIKVNYVFMTDGENNTSRTFVRGHGYGINDDWQIDMSPPVLSVHNTFHQEWPIIVGDQEVLEGVRYDGEDLDKLLKDAVNTGKPARPENVPGIATCLTESRLHNNKNRFVREREERSTNYENWNRLLLKETGYRYSYQGGDFYQKFGPNYDSRLNVSGLNNSLNYDYRDNNDKIKDEDDAYDYEGEIDSNLGRGGAGGPAPEADPSDWVLENDWIRERNRIGSSYFLAIPRTVSHSEEHDFLNPGRGWNYWAPANSANNPTDLSAVSSSTQTEFEAVVDDSGSDVTVSYKYITRGTSTRYYFLAEQIYLDYRYRYENITDEDVNMTNVRANYLPMGEIYANHMGSFIQNNGGGTLDCNEERTPHIFDADSNGNQRTFITQRITDFYPRYSFDGPPKQSRWKGASDTSTNGADRSSVYYYSWKDGGDWVSNLNPRAECDFLAAAQAKVLRKRDPNDPFKYQDATIYTVRYGGNGNASLMKSIANDPLNQTGDFTDAPTENEGAYFDVNTGSANLQAAFKNIASRIAVRISR